MAFGDKRLTATVARNAREELHHQTGYLTRESA
jgi:hypothetical protein